MKFCGKPVRAATAAFALALGSGAFLAANRVHAAPPTAPPAAPLLRPAGKTVMIMLRLRQVEVDAPVGQSGNETRWGSAPIIALGDPPGGNPKPSQVAVHSDRKNGNFEDQTTQIMAHLNDDGTITVHGVWRSSVLDKQPGGEDTRVSHECAFTRRLDQHKPGRVALFTTGRMTEYLEVVADYIPEGQNVKIRDQEVNFDLTTAP